MLGIAGAALIGARHGRHGLRIVVLVLLIAAVVGFVLWLRRRRARSGETQAIGSAVQRASLPGDGDERREVASVTRRWEGSGNERQNTIEARGLTKRYGGKLAVDALSFDIRPGFAFTGFLGPNGAGKSTTMRMIMGLDTPDAGTVTVNGLRYHDLRRPLREVGALLEARAIHPGRSAPAICGCWPGRTRSHEPASTKCSNLSACRRSLADAWAGSLGMSQRLGIAVALLGDPGVLMFDEPVNGLDTDGIRWVRTLLRQLASEGRAVFVSSRLMSEMALTADHVVVIGKGQLIAEMPIDEFTARNSNAYIRVRSPNIGKLRTALEGAGATVTAGDDGSLSVRGVTQEQVGELAWRTGIRSTNCRPNRHHSRRPLWNLPKGTLSSVAAALTGGAPRRVRGNGHGSGVGHPGSIGPKGHFGFSGILGSEWTKLTTVRSTVWTLLATAIVGIGLGAIVTSAQASRWATRSLAARIAFDPTRSSLAGLLFAELAIGVLGILVVSAEYSTGTIRATFSAVPRRPLVLMAKVAVFGVVTLIVGEIVSFVAFFIGQRILSGKAPSAVLSDPGVLRAVISGGLSPRSGPSGPGTGLDHPGYRRSDQHVRGAAVHPSDHRRRSPLFVHQRHRTLSAGQHRHRDDVRPLPRHRSVRTLDQFRPALRLRRRGFCGWWGAARSSRCVNDLRLQLEQMPLTR